MAHFLQDTAMLMASQKSARLRPEQMFMIGAVVGGAATMQPAEVLPAVWSVLQTASGQFPEIDPVRSVSSLFDGASHVAASAVQVSSDILEAGGRKIGSHFGAVVQSVRESIGQTAADARTMVCDHLQGSDAELLKKHLGEPASPCSKLVLDAAWNVMSKAAETLGVLEIGRRAWKKVFSRERAAVETTGASETEANIVVNVAISGDRAIESLSKGAGPDGWEAGSEVHLSDAERAAGIVWMSAEMRSRIEKSVREEMKAEAAARDGMENINEGDSPCP